MELFWHECYRLSVMISRHWFVNGLVPWSSMSHSLTRVWEGRQLIWMIRDTRFILAPRLCMERIHRIRRRLSVWSIVNRLRAAGYRFRLPTRCPRLILDHRRCRHVCGRTHKRWDLRHWSHCVFSDDSHFTLFHSSGRARVHCRQGERLINACI